jgi:iron(III) transport system permease protein
LPHLRVSLLGGMLIVLLHLLAELGALEELRFPTFTTAIYDQFGSTFNSAAANSLASVLVLLCLLALLGENRLRGRARYARLGTGTARPATRVRLRFLVIPAVLGLAVLSLLALGLPVGTLVFWMVRGTSTAFPLARLATTTFNSVWLGVVGALTTLLVALPVAWIAVRRPGTVSVLTERATYIAYALPGIVVALALIATTIRYARPLYQSTAMLLTAYGILFLPLALVSIRTALTQVPPVLDDVGRSLGAAPATVLRRVTLPLIAPGLGAGAALLFISITTELTATLLLAPIGTETLATRFWSHAESTMYGAAAPYAALIVIISAPMTFLLTRELARTRGA